MSHQLGTNLTVKWTYDGTLTASTAPALWVNGSASAVSVTWDTATAGIVRATAATSGRAVGDVVEFRGGSITAGGSTYPIESATVVLIRLPVVDASGNTQVDAASIRGQRTIYVSTTGNNANDGLSLATAKATYAGAAAIAVAGDCIRFGRGTHAVTVPLLFPDNVDIRGAGRGVTRLLLGAAGVSGAGTEGFTPGNDSVVEDLSFVTYVPDYGGDIFNHDTFIMSVSAGTGARTGWLIRRVDMVSSNFEIFDISATARCTGRIENCYFYTASEWLGILRGASHDISIDGGEFLCWGNNSETDFKMLWVTDGSVVRMSNFTWLAAGEANAGRTFYVENGHLFLSNCTGFTGTLDIGASGYVYTHNTEIDRTNVTGTTANLRAYVPRATKEETAAAILTVPGDKIQNTNGEVVASNAGGGGGGNRTVKIIDKVIR